MKQRQGMSKSGLGAGAVVGICIVLVLIICVTAWCVYAYRNPTSTSGLFLIDVSLFLNKLKYIKIYNSIYLSCRILTLEKICSKLKWTKGFLREKFSWIKVVPASQRLQKLFTEIL